MNSTLPDIEAWPEERLKPLYENISTQDVKAALAHEERSLRDLAVLLSPHARPYLEAMAQEAQRLTRWHFGRTINLYAPIYISNVCAADCLYCGFAVHSGCRQERVTLNAEAIENECKALSAMGYEHVLLLTGEAPKASSPAYIAEAVSIARKHFASVSIEVYSMEEADYAEMCRRGLEGMTLYMETYHRPTYEKVHPRGIKKDYVYRLDTMDRAGCAGVRKLTISALLGLYDWRMDVLWTALHGRHLQKEYWRSALSLSFPRLHHTPERFHVEHCVSDAELVQIMLALRLFFPEAGFNISTRECATFRDHLIPLGITAMSAGSSTRPGGYATRGEETLEQFETEDQRSPEEVVRAIRQAGYDPVWKDFDHAFDEVS